MTPSSDLLTQEVVEPNTSALRLETDYAYGAYGRKVSVSVVGADITTRSSTTTYDAKGQFVTSNANALGQKESWQYDPRFGQQPTSHSGPNGLTTTWSYDRFGRKISEIRADGTQTQFAYLFCSGVNGGTASCPVEILVCFTTPSVSSDADHQGDPAIKIYGIIDRDNNIRAICLYTATDCSPSRLVGKYMTRTEREVWGEKHKVLTFKRIVFPHPPNAEFLGLLAEGARDE